MSNLAQRSFAGGELSPALYARTDQVKYATGLRTCRNFLVLRDGGVSNRPGTEYIAPAIRHDKNSRLIPFVFNAEQSYALEFGHQRIRFLHGGALIKVPTTPVWAPSTDYTVGDLVSVSGVNYYCRVAHKSDPDLVPGIYPGWESAWFRLESEVFEIPTPFHEADLGQISYAQSADVLTLTVRRLPIHNLKRLGHTTWVLEEMVNAPSTPNPLNVFYYPHYSSTAVSFSKEIQFERLYVSAVSDTGEESLVSKGMGYFTVPIPGGGTEVVPIDVSSRHPALDAFKIRLEWDSVPNAREYRIYKKYEPIDYDQHQTVPWTLGTSYPSGTVVLGSDAAYYRSTTSHTSTSATRPIAGANWADNWARVADARFSSFSGDWAESAMYPIGGVVKHFGQYYYCIKSTTSSTAAMEPEMGAQWRDYWRLLKNANGLTGLLTVTGDNSFVDDGSLGVDFLTLPVVTPALFDDGNKYPGAVGYYQQRRILANTNEFPETLWASRIGDFSNFTRPSPLTDDAALSFTVSGNRVNEVRHILDIDRLMILTADGVWSVEGDGNGVLRPAAINARQKSYYGSAITKPVVVGNTLIYVQARGSTLRDISPDLVAGYKGNDLTIFSSHLFDGHTIKEICYQEIPHSTVWCVRNDGKVLGLTYIPEHQVWGWHKHDTDGWVESICCIPEGDEDRLYLVVRREVNGELVRYLERLSSRIDRNLLESCYVDSSMIYDGRNQSATTVTLSNGVNWLAEEDLMLTASSGIFVSGDVGNEIVLTAADGWLLRCRITGYTSPTVLSVQPQRDVPAELRGAATMEWSRAVDEVGGLEHLEGKRVSILADGFVEASPNNPSSNIATVVDGKVSLTRAYSYVRVGLPYIGDLETLDIDSPGGPTLKTKKMNINGVEAFVLHAKGIWAGPKLPTGPDPVEGFMQLKGRLDEEDYDTAVEPITDSINITFENRWNSNGRVAIRQIDPIPLTVLSIAPSGYYPIA